MEIRKLAPLEVDLHKDIRLRALRDSPDSFGETLAEAERQPESYWIDLTRSVTEPGHHVMILACEGNAVLGSAYGLLDRERPDGGRVGGMWVEPARRRQGIGRALLEADVAWARDFALVRLGLWAPAQSPGAIALYRNAGFQETGRRQPLPGRPELEIVEMVRDLKGPQGGASC